MAFSCTHTHHRIASSCCHIQQNTSRCLLPVVLPRLEKLPSSRVSHTWYSLHSTANTFAFPCGSIRWCSPRSSCAQPLASAFLQDAKRCVGSSVSFPAGDINSSGADLHTGASSDEHDMGADGDDALPKQELYRLVSTRLNVPVSSVRYVVEESKNGATVPFLARYRQDASGHLDEEMLRAVLDTTTEMKEVHRRRQFMLKSLKQRGLLTPALQASLEQMVHLSQLEDAWEPYKERKNTLAARGREAGLEQFVEPLLHGHSPVEGLPAAVQRVDDGERLMIAVLSEELQRNEALRRSLLEHCRRTGYVHCTLVQKARKKEAKEMRDADFEMLQKKFAPYHDRHVNFTRLEAHTVLALQRGENKGVLKVDMGAGRDGRQIFSRYLETHATGVPPRLVRPDKMQNSGGSNFSVFERKLVQAAATSAFEHLMKAALNTVYRDVRKSAEKASIHVFAHNLRQMLLQRPLAQSRLLAMDPGVRNGVKCVSLDANGALTSCFKCTLMETEAMQSMIVKSVKTHDVNRIAIGNGTASQETTKVVSDTIRKFRLTGVEFAVVNEAGASVYSVSEVAKEEFPTLDIMYRGAVSIGRRVLDPLSELVKIPVRSMGIGMYQHDVNEKELGKALGRVLESCVAKVGVNAASANRYVMEQVPGIEKKAVDQIVLARHSRALNSREDLRRVPGMTEAMFQQIAGFFRFPNSAEPLDATSIHPESYDLARKLLRLYDEGKLTLDSSSSQEPVTSTEAAAAAASAGPEAQRRAATGQVLLRMPSSQLTALAGELHCGVETLRLVAQELCEPGLDPRESLPHAGLMRTALTDKSELQAGQVLTGVVLSVTTFGTFLDCGLHDAVLLRGHGVDRLQVGSLVQNVTFNGLDALGRVQVVWDGVSGTGLLKEGLRQKLQLEMEDTLAKPTTTSSSSAPAHNPSRSHAGMKRGRSSSPQPSPQTRTVTAPPQKRAALEPAPPAAVPHVKAHDDAAVDAAVAAIMEELGSTAPQQSSASVAKTGAVARDDEVSSEASTGSSASSSSTDSARPRQPHGRKKQKKASRKSVKAVSPKPTIPSGSRHQAVKAEATPDSKNEIFTF